MKLLITTQALDQHDSDLGFFVRWVEEFAKHCAQVTVVCLREGEHALSHNVRIHVVPRGKLARTARLLRIMMSEEYNAVFVHMNPEYLVLVGWLWRLRGKQSALWYTHKSVDLKLRIAEKFADVIFTASKESFRLRSYKVRVMGHGIDTDFFCPDPQAVRKERLLSVGRLMPSKRHDLAIQAAVEQGRTLLIAGEGPERKNLEVLAQKLGAQVKFLGPLTQEELREEYRRAAGLIHTSETGSLDKVVLEAVACGCPVKTNDPALKYLEQATPAYVREHHSLKNLIPAILKNLA